VLSSLFKLAIISGVESVIRFYIRRGNDVNARDDRGRSPLLLAASKGDVSVCRLLLDLGADPLVADSEGATVLELAKTKGFTEIADIIKERIAGISGVLSQGAGSEAVAADEFDHNGGKEHTESPPARHDDSLNLKALSLLQKTKGFTENTDLLRQCIAGASGVPSQGVGSEEVPADGFDHNGWEEYIESPPAPHDDTVKLKALSLQNSFSQYEPVHGELPNWPEYDVWQSPWAR
jgi:RNA polymerase primary sigma factor